jgi:hypothetical protein
MTDMSARVNAADVPEGTEGFCPHCGDCVLSIVNVNDIAVWAHVHPIDPKRCDASKPEMFLANLKAAS